MILANNGPLESLGFAQNRLTHVFPYASMTMDLPPETLRQLGGQPGWGVTPSDPMVTTMRRIDTAWRQPQCHPHLRQLPSGDAAFGHRLAPHRHRPPRQVRRPLLHCPG